MATSDHKSRMLTEDIEILGLDGLLKGHIFTRRKEKYISIEYKPSDRRTKSALLKVSLKDMIQLITELAEVSKNNQTV